MALCLYSTEQSSFTAATRCGLASLRRFWRSCVMDATREPDFLAPRRCLREPIQELWDVATLLHEAADAHLKGDRQRAEALLRETNQPAVRAWTESLWGSARANPDQWRYIRLRAVPEVPPRLPKAQRVPVRNPTAAEETAIVALYGRHCIFCGVPLIRSEIRRKLHQHYPDAVPWGRTNPSQHAAFQALWMQFDHLLPHSRGGDNSLPNVVVTCAGCNYGRKDNTLEELGLIDPRSRTVYESTWDGLERVLAR
jgi:hypothetical protein